MTCGSNAGCVLVLTSDLSLTPVTSRVLLVFLEPLASPDPEEDPAPRGLRALVVPEVLL